MAIALAKLAIPPAFVSRVQGAQNQGNLTRHVQRGTHKKERPPLLLLTLLRKCLKTLYQPIKSPVS